MQDQTTEIPADVPELDTEAAPQDEYDVEKDVAEFIELRDELRDVENRLAEEKKRLRNHMERINQRLLEFCKAHNMDSVRTPAGAVYRQVRERFRTTDWDAFDRFVLEHEVPQLYERRISQQNMREWLEESPEEIPEGFIADRWYAVSVRKPTNR